MRPDPIFRARPAGGESVEAQVYSQMQTNSANKLRERLEGTVITATALKGNTLEIGFDDGTWMAVDRAPDASQGTLPTGGTVEAVDRQGNTLELRMQGGDSVQIETDPTHPMVTVVQAGVAANRATSLG